MQRRISQFDWQISFPPTQAVLIDSSLELMPIKWNANLAKLD